MKKIFYLVILSLVLISCVPATPAPAPKLTWAVGAGSGGHASGLAIATDINYNCYTTGYFTDKASFGEYQLIGTGEHEIFVTKQDSQGEFVWAVGAGGGDWDYGQAVAADNKGNCYVAGTFYHEAQFGDIKLSGESAYNIFVGKINKHGTWAWVIQANGKGEDKVEAMAVDARGNIYISGFFNESIQMGNNKLISQDASDVFLAKINKKGKWQWAKAIAGKDDDVAKAICLDAKSNVYIAGHFYDNITFNEQELSATGESDIFVAKYANDGKLLWGKTAGGEQGDAATAITCDAYNTYLAGYFDSSLAWGKTKLTSHGERDIFVCSMDNTGKAGWAIRAGGKDNDEASELVLMNNNLYLTGYYTGTANFGEINFTATGPQDIFVASLDIYANCRFSKSYGGTDYDMARTLALDKNADIYLSGYFSKQITFGDTSLTGKGQSSVFIYKIDTP